MKWWVPKSYPVRVDRQSLMKDIAYVCSKLDDGIPKTDAYEYFESGPDKYDRSFIDLSVEMGLEAGWILKSYDNRFTLTAAGRKSISNILRGDEKDTKK